MRINNYNKFFAEVAKIMNTDVKAVKHLDGRYKVELANHVYLNVYRGVSGSLFIHDHRGIVHITSCYDFEDFKTLNDLYERLVTDYSESDTAHNEETEETEKVDIDETYTDNLEDCTDEFATQYAEETNRLTTPTHEPTCNKVKTSSIYGMFGGFPTIPDMYNDKCFCCPADRQGNRCCGEKWCKATWKRYEAIIKPEWHNVSLATLANIDNDMLDEKRQNYMYLRNLLKDFRKYAFNIKRRDVYFDMVSNVIRDIQQMWFDSTISFTAYEYAMRHLQVVSVEKGYFDSRREAVFAFKETRRYKVTLR